MDYKHGAVFGVKTHVEIWGRRRRSYTIFCECADKGHWNIRIRGLHKLSMPGIMGLCVKDRGEGDKGMLWSDEWDLGREFLNFLRKMQVWIIGEAVGRYWMMRNSIWK